MTWDSVPWAVGGGAVHSSEVARLVTYIATGGQQGVLNATDLAVLPLSVPGAGVRVLPGACVIVNKALNVSNDSYVARLPSEDQVTTQSNGSGGVRSDLVVARVENPFISGEPWSLPQDVTVGPYIFTRVIQNVPANTVSLDALGLGYTGIPLARIDFPINTSTVTAGMIKDLRSVVHPAATTPAPSDDSDSGDDVGDIAPTVVYIVIPSSGSDVLPYTATGWTNWPSAANWTISTPKWATHLELDINISNFAVTVADFYATLQVLVDGVSVCTQEVDVRIQDPTKPLRASVHLGVEYKLPSNLRGHKIAARVQAKFHTDSRCNGSQVIADTVTQTHGHHRHHCRPSHD